MDTSSFLYLRSLTYLSFVPIAQRKERRSPESEIEVRVLVGTQKSEDKTETSGVSNVDSIPIEVHNCEYMGINEFQLLTEIFSLDKLKIEGMRDLFPKDTELNGGSFIACAWLCPTPANFGKTDFNKIRIPSSKKR